MNNPQNHNLVLLNTIDCQMVIGDELPDLTKIRQSLSKIWKDLELPDTNFETLLIPCRLLCSPKFTGTATNALEIATRLFCIDYFHGQMSGSIRSPRRSASSAPRSTR